MNHDVFISYSNKDQKVVEALSHYLEERGIRCFVAYRDIPKGKVWASVITEAIENCQMMVVVFSKDFNISEQVDREIELCAEEKKPILTFRIQDEAFKGAKKYYLKNLNWIDAFPNPNECFQSLYESIGKLLNIEIRQTNDIVTLDASKSHKKAELITQIEQPKNIIRVDNKNISTDNHGFANFSETVNRVGFDMVAVEGGTFKMGSNEFDNEQPIHQVTVSDFFISKFPVTQKQWQAVIGNNPSHFKGGFKPVESVSWFDAIAFCNKLNEMVGLNHMYHVNENTVTLKTSTTGYRLPTEAEWEYAARGGTQGKGYVYSGSNKISEVAEYEGNNNKTTKPVGCKLGNELGLCDMSGNVLEWCHDWYGAYPNKHQTDPLGPSSGTGRVLRGGCWYFISQSCRVFNRINHSPEGRYNYLGFRLVLAP